MGEDNDSRLFDRIEQMARTEERHHRDVMVKLAKLENDQEHQEEDMARHQQAIAAIENYVQLIKQERAGEKGRLTGMLVVATFAGNAIMVILSRTGVLNAIFGG